MSKHPEPSKQPISGPDDLDRNPGIGQSQGLDRQIGLEEIEGENTAEGDVGNDVDATGAIDPEHRGRNNP